MHQTIANLANKIVPVGNAFDPASEQNIADAESLLGLSFPSLLVDLLRTYGRFMFDGEALIQVDQDPPLGIFTFFGCKGDVGNLVLDVGAHPDYMRLGLLPIADDMFNNRYVLDIGSNAILFIDYVRQLPPSVVASSLEEFLRKIEVVPD